VSRAHRKFAEPIKVPMSVTDIAEPVERGEPTRPSLRYVAPDPSDVHDSGWSAVQRIAFRFVCAYFLLYVFPFPLDFLPWPAEWWGALELALARWTETHVFGLAEALPIVPTGSGDTMAAWAIQVNWLILAAIVAITWTVVDWRRRHYRRLHDWLRIYVRFALAAIMFGYGFAKIIPNQMPPSLERLVQPWGEFSPMGVLWSFMGHSPVYQIFTGVGEALGALLLAFRRTVTLGALLLCAVLANVVLLNYTFDVPVKLYSTNLLLMAIFLAAPDAKRLVDLLVFGRQPSPPSHASPFTSRRVRMAAVSLAVLFVLYNAGTAVSGNLDRYRQSTGPNAPKTAVWGIWDVVEVQRNGAVRPMLLTDSTLLRRIVFGQLSRATFRTISDSVERFTVSVDSTAGTLALTGRFNPSIKRTLAYTRPDSASLILREQLGGDSVITRLRRVDERRFLLLHRGFNWIQEQAFNR
jgi:hypothetical protein